MDTVAHLRFLQASNQCELVVCLNTEFEGISIIDEMHSVRRVTDTVGSLIDHTKNKLIKFINDKLSTEGEQKADRNYKIPVYFKKKMENYSVDVIPDISLEVFLKQNHKKTVVTIFDQEFKLIVNPPFIKSMLLPTILYATYSIEPLRFYGLYTEKLYSEFIWFKSKDKSSWQTVGSGFEYTISNEDLGYYLKVVCNPVSANLIKGPQAEAISERTVQEFPELPSCPFETRHESTNNKLEGPNFRFVTYNTLSKRYTESNGIFSYCTPETLSIEYRKQLILKELIGYNADIICLQEVDHREYNSYFHKKLSAHGYISKFHRKGNNLPEGLLCAVNQLRYKLLSYQQLVLANALHTKPLFAPLYQAMKKDKDLTTQFMKQSTSLQTITLKCKEVKRILVIGNTHLYYHPKATNIRLIQAYMVTKYLSCVKQRMLGEWKNFEVDVILCGDFNSSPNGGVYSFLCNGVIPPDSNFYLKKQGQNILSHDLDFVSACGTPKYTNYTEDFKSCLDYIFIQNNKIEVTQVVPLPEEELDQYVGLPNEVYPSDHVALVVDLQFRDI